MGIHIFVDIPRDTACNRFLLQALVDLRMMATAFPSICCKRDAILCRAPECGNWANTPRVNCCLSCLRSTRVSCSRRGLWGDRRTTSRGSHCCRRRPRRVRGAAFGSGWMFADRFADRTGLMPQLGTGLVLTIQLD